MSQIFQMDAQQSTAATGFTLATFVAAVTTNNLNPPFGNCKAVIRAIVQLTLGAAPTNVTIRVVRNPTGDNTTVATSGPITSGITNGLVPSLSIACVDLVPDGRPVQYQLQVQCNGAAGTGILAEIDATLISG